MARKRASRNRTPLTDDTSGVAERSGPESSERNNGPAAHDESAASSVVNEPALDTNDRGTSPGVGEPQDYQRPSFVRRRTATPSEPSNMEQENLNDEQKPPTMRRRSAVPTIDDAEKDPNTSADYQRPLSVRRRTATPSEPSNMDQENSNDEQKPPTMRRRSVLPTVNDAEQDPNTSADYQRPLSVRRRTATPSEPSNMDQENSNDEQKPPTMRRRSAVPTVDDAEKDPNTSADGQRPLSVRRRTATPSEPSNMDQENSNDEQKPPTMRRRSAVPTVDDAEQDPNTSADYQRPPTVRRRTATPSEPSNMNQENSNDEQKPPTMRRRSAVPTVKDSEKDQSESDNVPSGPLQSRKILLDDDFEKVVAPDVPLKTEVAGENTCPNQTEIVVPPRSSRKRSNSKSVIKGEPLKKRVVSPLTYVMRYSRIGMDESPMEPISEEDELNLEKHPEKDKDRLMKDEEIDRGSEYIYTVDAVATDSNNDEGSSHLDEDYEIVHIPDPSDYSEYGGMENQGLHKSRTVEAKIEGPDLTAKDIGYEEYQDLKSLKVNESNKEQYKYEYSDSDDDSFKSFNFGNDVEEIAFVKSSQSKAGDDNYNSDDYSDSYCEDIDSEEENNRLASVKNELRDLAAEIIEQSKMDVPKELFKRVIMSSKEDLACLDSLFKEKNSEFEIQKDNALLEYQKVDVNAKKIVCDCECKILDLLFKLQFNMETDTDKLEREIKEQKSYIERIKSVAVKKLETIADSM